MGYQPIGFAGGSLFRVTHAGPALNINTTIPHHTYPKVGIKVLTPGASIANESTTCTMAGNGYCLFSVSDTQTKSILIIGSNPAYTVSICLNGEGALSCQQFSNQDFIIYKSATEVPQRLQWHQNFGYCGETSYITTGLGLGQYTSQYAMRALASGGPQNGENDQLLLGVNDIDAHVANLAKLKHNRLYDCTVNSNDFLTWVKSELYQGHPVIIGVYLNEYLFYRNQVTSPISCTYHPHHEPCSSPLHCVPTGIPSSTSSDGICQYGEPEYDHIVTVTQITTQHPCIDAENCEYFDDDVITIDDHGLYTSECDYGNQYLSCPMNSTQTNLCRSSKTLNYRYLYSYYFGEFQKSRAAANSPTGSEYSLSNTPSEGHNCTSNYGIAIHGVKGDDLLPVNVRINTNFECDMIEEHMNTYYPVSGLGPVIHYPIVLTVTVSNMEAGRQYYLYQYDSFNDVPESNFNQSTQYVARWLMSRSTGSTKSVTIANDQTAIFRAVPVDAP